MRKSIIILASILLSVVFSCGKASDKQTERSDRELLHAVPSDAIAAVCFEDCSKGLKMLLDSTDRLLQLNLGKLRHARAVLAYEYVGAVSPILLIETRSGSSENEALADQAQSLGMMVVILNPGSVAGRHSALLIASSSAVMSSVAKHVGAETSILDAPGFSAALSAAGNQKEVAFIRHSSIDKLLPAGFLNELLPRREAVSFLKQAADWSVVGFKDPAHLNIAAVNSGSDTYYPNMAATLKDGRCHVADVLPQECTGTISLPIDDIREFREKYELYLDANVRLDRYRDKLRELKKQSGKDPLKWEVEKDIKEVALICSGDSRVVLVRPARRPRIKGIESNPHRGFPEALFGKVFDVPDDSCRCAKGHWIAYGDEESLRDFKESASGKWKILPKTADYVIMSESHLFSSTGKGMSIDVLKP